jgi:hypothetical protein
VNILEADVRIMCDEYELEVRLDDEIFVEMVAGLQVVGPAPALHPAWRTHTFKMQKRNFAFKITASSSVRK